MHVDLFFLGKPPWRLIVKDCSRVTSGFFSRVYRSENYSSGGETWSWWNSIVKRANRISREVLDTFWRSEQLCRSREVRFFMSAVNREKVKPRTKTLLVFDL